MTTLTHPQARSVNPATGEAIATHPYFDRESVERRLAAAADAQPGWAQRSFEQRAHTLREIATALRHRQDECAALIVAEMGKTVVEARAEVEKCAWVSEHYATHGAQYLASAPVDVDAADGYVQYVPLGVVLAVMPWNYPFWQVFRAGVPALIGGNTVVLKHASNVTGCARLVGDIVRGAAGSGLLEVVVVPGNGVGELIADPRIAAVTLTGSDAAGAAVAAECATHLKRSVLELGGSDPFIVLPDADLDVAVPVAVRSRFQNAGQSCIAAKRFVAVGDAAEEFGERLATATDELRVGDPADEATQIGPMSSAASREELADQLARGVEQGATVLTRRVQPSDPGAFFVPTVVRASADSPLCAEETFGPLAVVVRAESEDEAVAIANDSVYGLSASLWTSDLAHARRLTPRIQAGSVFVNRMSASDPRMPIGGIKRSGWGRELGASGPREFVNQQSVVID